MRIFVCGEVEKTQLRQYLPLSFYHKNNLFNQFVEIDQIRCKFMIQLFFIHIDVV